MPKNLQMINTDTKMIDSNKELKQERRVWREMNIKKKFLNAFRGFFVFFETTKHFFFIQLPLYLILIVPGFYFHISNSEWTQIVFAIGFITVSEIFNTAIEIDIDLTSPEYHPYARDTKDVAAAAVALSGVVAGIVWLIIFLPKIF